MKRLSMTIGFLPLAFAAAATLWAQAPAPKPGPELKKLDYFLGTWTLDGDSNPGPMGPGGKTTMIEDASWMDGRFFLVERIRFKSPMGNGTGLAVMGYNPEEKAYTYDEFDSTGEVNHSKGTSEGDTWTWSSEAKMGGQTMKMHFIMKIVSPTEYDFKFEMSQDGDHWNTLMDGKATKAAIEK
jgi:Protein of unknown function (DUF1579)